METTQKTTFIINDNEITYTRLFDAPRQLVWEAWTKSEYLEKWFGPEGFTLTTSALDFRQNGIWKFVMHGPDGTDYPNKIEYLELIEPEKLSYRHVDDEDTEAIAFTVHVFFEEHGDQTILRMQHIFRSAEELRRVAEEYGAIEGGVQTIDRLANLVEK